MHIPESTVLDAFELLGVSHREDSYTDLIVHGFTLDRTFRKRVLRYLGERDSDDWKARSRVRVTRRESRRADVPDIVLANPRTRKLIVIENKIWAGEGENQLARYCDDDFKAALADRMFDGGDGFDEYRLVYLTLDTRRLATSIECDIASYDDFCREVFASPLPADSLVADLLGQMGARVRNRARWRPDPTAPLSALFEGGPSLLSDRERLERFVRELVSPGDLEIYSGVVNNPQHGSTPLVQISSARWVRSGSTEAGFAGTRNVHFEIQWLGRDGLSVEVHFETEPYLVRSIAKRDQDEYDRFRSEQEMFQTKFFGAGPDRWKRTRQRGWVSIAVLDHQISGSTPYWLPHDLPAGEAASRIREAIGTGISAIDSALERPQT